MITKREIMERICYLEMEVDNLYDMLVELEDYVGGKHVLHK